MKQVYSLLDMNVVPDVVTRAGMRKFLQDRINQSNKGSFEVNSRSSRSSREKERRGGEMNSRS
jgi:hypothetical protein